MPHETDAMTQWDDVPSVKVVEVVYSSAQIYHFGFDLAESASVEVMISQHEIDRSGSTRRCELKQVLSQVLSVGNVSANDDALAIDPSEGIEEHTLLLRGCPIKMEVCEPLDFRGFLW